MVLMQSGLCNPDSTSTNFEHVCNMVSKERSENCDWCKGLEEGNESERQYTKRESKC